MSPFFNSPLYLELYVSFLPLCLERKVCLLSSLLSNHYNIVSTSPHPIEAALPGLQQQPIGRSPHVLDGSSLSVGKKKKRNVCLSVWIFTCKLQLTLEQHGFELWRSSYLQIFFNKHKPHTAWSVAGWIYGYVHAELCRSCLTLCDPMDYSPPGFSVHGILQVRILKWVAVSSSMGSSWPRNRTHISWVSSIVRQVPPRKPHRCGGPTIKYTRIFYYIEVGTANLCLVQGSTVYTYASVHILYYKIETKINILKDGFNIEDWMFSLMVDGLYNAWV